MIMILYDSLFDDIHIYKLYVYIETHTIWYVYKKIECNLMCIYIISMYINLEEILLYVEIRGSNKRDFVTQISDMAHQWSGRWIKIQAWHESIAAASNCTEHPV